MMIRKLFYQNKSFKFLIFTFISARLFCCMLIFLFLPLYDPRFFTFKDLEFYKEVPSGIFTPNFLFAYLIKFIGYDSSNIHSYNFLIFSFLISIIIFLPWIFLSKKILKNNSSFLYTLLLGCHPYLALYSLKFDSTSFVVLPVAFFVIEKFLPIYRLNLLPIVTSTLSSFFRSQILLLAWIQIFFIFLKRKILVFNKKSFYIFIILILLSFCSFIQFNYGADILTQNFGCYTFPNIKNYFLEKGLIDFLSSFISFILTPIIHLFLLIGAREAISIYCISLPTEIAQYPYLNIFSTICFFLLHGYSLFRMLDWILANKKNNAFKLLIPFVLIIPNLYGMAHMRYFIPFIPYVIIFLFDIKKSKIN